jgi:hypothetical protein
MTRPNNGQSELYEAERNLIQGIRNALPVSLVLWALILWGVYHLWRFVR